MLQICKDLFLSWNADGIPYCHWKSNEHLMEGLDGFTDLDVFADINYLDAIENTLKTLCFIKATPQKGCKYDFVDEWIGFDNCTGRLIHLHLHYRLITGTKYSKEYIIPLDTLIIETRALDPNTAVYIANPNLELIILYSRIVLKACNKKRFDIEEYKTEISYLQKKKDTTQLFHFCELCFPGDESVLYELLNKQELSNKEWREVYCIVSKWLSHYRIRTRFSAIIRLYYFRFRYLLLFGLNKYFNTRFFVRKTLPNQSFSVCFIGQDGSGKSTLTTLICKWLNWKIEASRYYLGSGDHYKGLLKVLLPKAAEISHRVSPEENSSCSSKSSKTRQIIKQVIKFFSRILNSISLRNIAAHAYREVIHAYKYKTRLGIAIFDRFPQNQFPAVYDGPKIRFNYIKYGKASFVIRQLARQEEIFIDKAQQFQPDIIFKLVLPVEESMKRKPEENVAQVKQKALITERLCFDNSKVFIVDATQDFDEEVLYVKRIIWKEIAERNL